MSTLPVLALPFSGEPTVFATAQVLAAKLGRGEAISRSILNATLTGQFGSSDAAGRWSVRDAHAALELAQVLWLQAQSALDVQSTPDEATRHFDRLEALVPRQTVRSDEQIELQQFATPPRIAWLAARACAPARRELVLEPSAGTGMLAVWADKAGARLALNEISGLRCDCLAHLFPAAEITGHDGELINDLLAPALRPQTVLMNPPYSWSAERGRDGRTAMRHLRSAWNRLAACGRLAAILPEWFDLPAFLSRTAEPAALRLDLSIERGFVAHGTSITTRLLVIDKLDVASDPVTGRGTEFLELCAFVDAIPARLAPPSLAAIPPRPLKVLPLLRLSARPMPVAANRGANTSEAAAVSFSALEVPAATPEQVGHYLPYRPSRIAIPGAAHHPTPLVESVAMGSITAPVPSVVPKLPGHVIAKGLLSAAQIETLIYAASAHARDLPGLFMPEDKGCILVPSAEGKAYRMGYFLGDGTGAGKGRQVASVILDRWVQGQRRHIWISKNEALLEDARRDWAALGGLPIDIQPLATWKLGSPVMMPEGILFVTYPTLRSGRADATRLDQILAWAGEDFEGVIVFDEAHAMANAAGGEGSRGKVKGSEQGVAGVRLQNLLPRARVLYASATGASDVNNLAYATRLGLWGPETAFATREEFVTDIRAGGIAAMELVARDLKALGLYTARALSFAGVEYEILEHALSADQIAVYDAYADAWATIHTNLREALEANRILALPIALQNGIFDEFLGLVEARIDAARAAGTLDLGLETIAVESFEVLSDSLLRTDSVSGATTHLLELEIARALKPLTLERLEQLEGARVSKRFLRNGRSGRAALLVPARSLLADDGTRITRYELVRPLRRGHLTAEQLAESSWEPVDEATFRTAWQAEVDEALSSLKRERLHLATGLLLPVWDKLPADHVRVSRISASDGRSLLGREVPLHAVGEIRAALGLDAAPSIAPDELVRAVLGSGRPMAVKAREALMLKRSLVNGLQRLELTGWSASRLDWYKAHGCFTEIIRFQTRLFVPLEGATKVLERLDEGNSLR